MSELVVTGVSAAPGGNTVLANVDLSVASGSVVALLGPSGAGKTTLLRVITGLEVPTTGTIRSGGRDVTRLKPEKRGLAVVFQDARLFPTINVRDNVAFPLRMAGVSRRKRRDRAESLLDEVGLSDFGDRSPNDLSGGERQRVALARALAGEPAALLLDEPFASVDPSRRDELMELVAEVQRRHTSTVLLVTHDRDEAARMGDEVAILIGGRVVQQGSPREVFTQPASTEVADFVGCDVRLAGPVEDGMMTVGPWQFGVDGPDADDAVAVTRPELVRVNTGGHAEATVTRVEEASDHVALALNLGGAPIRAHVPFDGLPAVGDLVEVAFAGLWRLTR